MANDRNWCLIIPCFKQTDCILIIAHIGISYLFFEEVGVTILNSIILRFFRNYDILFSVGGGGGGGVGLWAL